VVAPPPAHLPRTYELLDSTLRAIKEDTHSGDTYVEDSDCRCLAELVSAVGDVPVVGQTGDAPGMIWAVQELWPDVAILDVRFEDDGLRVLLCLRT
jgi:hypothetical protein